MKDKKRAIDAFFERHDGLSDMDYSYNPETEEFDVPAIEWDGIYGKHWQRFESEEARQVALDAYSQSIKDFEKVWEREQKAKELKRIADKKKRIADFNATKNSLGNLFPDFASQFNALTLAI